MPYALCPMPYALCTSEHVTEKGYNTFFIILDFRFQILDSRIGNDIDSGATGIIVDC